MVLDILAVAITFLAVAVCSVPVGKFIAAVMTGKRTFLSPVLGPVERLIYKCCGIDPSREQGWKGYTVSVLVMSFISMFFSYIVMRTQNYLPFNPQHLKAVPPALALNTAMSFLTNTNWQNYAGEVTMSYFSQMVALVTHQYLSAASATAMAVALIRGLTRRSTTKIGNYYVDLTRACLYVLLPMAFVVALILISQGAVQDLGNYVVVHAIQGGHQIIAQGPAASQEAIKDLGTNGGGFFNANSAHPYENPNGFTNMFEIFIFLLIPFGLAFTFGKMANNMRQGVSIFAAMWICLLISTVIVASSEQYGNPLLGRLGVTQAATSNNPGGNLEGKDVMFGSIQSAAFAASTTGTSTGSVDSSHDSYTPLGGLALMVQIQLGEITPGDVGSGLYGMLIFAIIAVFIAGLMVGRTPEYLGKKIESREVKLAALAILVLPLSILGLTAIATMTSAGQAGPISSDPIAHQFSEILYAYTSVTGNNGSAFAGLSGNTDFYNLTMLIGMWLGRIMYLIPVMALAGSVAKKKIVPASSGTFPTDTPMFSILLVGVIIIVGALTFFPALALGPILEHLQLFHMAAHK